jgi:mevalonate pyrophosphate decarboxylase
VSTFRKTVLTTAIIGAGLASTSGAAFASECHDGGHHGDHHKSSSKVSDSCISGSGSGSKNAEGGLLSIASVADAPISSNICNVLNNNLNGNLSGNSLAINGLL